MTAYLSRCRPGDGNIITCRADLTSLNPLSSNLSLSRLISSSVFQSHSLSLPASLSLYSICLVSLIQKWQHAFMNPKKQPQNEPKQQQQQKKNKSINIAEQKLVNTSCSYGSEVLTVM